MRVGTDEQIRWLPGLIGAIFILNAVDAVFTVYWVLGKDTWEANPFMDELLARHPLLFLGVKLFLAAAGSWLLWRYRHRPLAVVGLFGLFIVYYWLLAGHLYMFGELVLPVLVRPGSWRA
ncbi:MAG: hypothetical protein FJ098_05710 [Deltaproteobacteria bacterium]|nr:hypothetical protein [Deltaproteobacteria bacterium]